MIKEMYRQEAAAGEQDRIKKMLKALRKEYDLRLEGFKRELADKYDKETALMRVARDEAKQDAQKLQQVNKHDLLKWAG